MENKLLAVFMKNNCKKLIKKNLELKKILKTKGNKSYVKWKEYNNLFNSWIDKKDLIKRVSTFHHIEVLEQLCKFLDLSSYATKADLKNVTHVDVRSVALKIYPSNIKTEVDKMDIAKLTPVPDDLATLSNVVKNDVVKKSEYNKLVKNVDKIDTTGLVLKLNVILINQI